MEKGKNKISPKKEHGSILREKAYLQLRLNGDLEEQLVKAKNLSPKEQKDEFTAFAINRLNSVNESRKLIQQSNRERLADGVDNDNVITPSQPLAAPPRNNWVPIGPSAVRKGQAVVEPVVSGRVQGIQVSPNGRRIYVGTANGGVWRSEDQGNSWISLMDSFDTDVVLPSPNPDPVFGNQGRADSLSCGAIEVVFRASPKDDIIFVGTGEPHFAFGSVLGVGPIVSFNGGRSWLTESVRLGDPDLLGTGFYSFAIEPGEKRDSLGNPFYNIVAATRRGLYRREPDGNGSFHWVLKVLPGATNPITSTVLAHDGINGRFYAVDTNGSVFSSSDGNIWTQDGASLPGANTIRTTLAVHPGDSANPANINIVYAFRQDGNVFRMDRTVNPGNPPWTLINGIPPANLLLTGQGFYDLSIAVAPDNFNRIYLGGSRVPTNAAGMIVNPNVPGFNPNSFSGALYRCDLVVTGANASVSVSPAPFYIGNSIHADIHALTFVQGDSNQLWVGCDGGVFFTNNATGPVPGSFVSKNVGLQTLTMNHLAQHPTEEAYLFCGTQDNGCQRFNGDEVWLHAAPGDCGFAVVNWDNPRSVIATSFNNGVRRSTNGGDKGSFTSFQLDSIHVPTLANERLLFYSPMVGTPPDSANPTNANIVAFGSERPWISNTFGGNLLANLGVGDWVSIPSGTIADSLGAEISALAFSLPTAPNLILYAGTIVGRVERYIRNAAGTWTAAGQTRIDVLGGANSLPAFLRAITDIAIDPADATGQSIYVTIGGNSDFRHVWHFDGAVPRWEQRSGPGPIPPPPLPTPFRPVDSRNLFDVHHSSIVVDPSDSDNLYVGTDIGIWRSTKAGTEWEPFSEGLPDTSVVDLKILPAKFNGPTLVRPALLRATTHGRGVYERTLDVAPLSIDKKPVELWVRDTVLDAGRPNDFSTNAGMDPVTGNPVSLSDSPDIKVDSFDPAIPGNEYQFDLLSGNEINFVQFVDNLTDKSEQVLISRTDNILSKVYVQVHNRGVVAADEVQVMLLLATAKPSIPKLPSNYHEKVQQGVPINEGGWKTIEIKKVDDVRVGFPRIVVFDLNAQDLPGPDVLDTADELCLVIFLKNAMDDFTPVLKALPGGSTTIEQDITVISSKNPKACHKIMKIQVTDDTYLNLDDRSTLQDFVSIPEGIVTAESPFDLFLGRAFRQNDLLFQDISTSLLSAPLIPNGVDNHVVNPSPIQLVNAKTIHISSIIKVESQVPLIWMATEKIVINSTIDGQGKGAPSGKVGDFGGSGGGGSDSDASVNQGQACVLPVSGVSILNGVAEKTEGNSSDSTWITRAFSYLALCQGGASGGGRNGGPGGGVVFLFAPLIEFRENGKINVAGNDGGDNSGGGGGGVIILIANQIKNLKDTGGQPDRNIDIRGGDAASPSGKGGEGICFAIGKRVMDNVSP